MNRYNANMRIYTIMALLILSAFMLPVIACGGGTQTSPDIDARVQAEIATETTIEARVKDELAKAMSTATVTPIPTVTASTLKQHLQQHRTP